MVYKRRRPIGGKIEVKYLNKLLNESYKSKGKTNANIDDRYILDNELSTDKTKVYVDKNTNDIAMIISILCACVPNTNDLLVLLRL